MHDGNVRWYFCSTEHYATITITFMDRSSETELKVECRGVPDNEEERTKEGWKRYYFEAIKQTFGYGARLFWRWCTVVLFSFLFWIFKLLVLSLSLWHKLSYCKLTARVNERDEIGEANLSPVCVNVLILAYLNLDFSPSVFGSVVRRSVNGLCLWDSGWKMEWIKQRGIYWTTNANWPPLL